MPAVLACPLQGEAPVEPKISSHDVAVSLAGSVPEMYRRTLAAMIDGHKISSLIPLPLIDCCSKQAIDPSTGISKVEESQETLEDFPKEIVSKSDGEADVETSSKAHDSSVPAVSEPKADVETTSKAHDSSVPAVSKPKVAKVAMVPHKGLGARIKTWLGCVQASAAEPKSLKAAKKGKSKPAKEAKSKPAMKTQ
jgi:hypothetical protein